MKKSTCWKLLEHLFALLIVISFIFIFFRLGYTPVSFIVAIVIFLIGSIINRYLRICKSLWVYKEGGRYIDDFILEDDIEEAKYVFGVKTKFDEKLEPFLKKTKEELLIDYLETIGYNHSSDLINKKIKADVLKSIIQYKESNLQQYFTGFLMLLNRTMIGIVFIQILVVGAITFYTMPEIEEKMILGINVKFILLSFIIVLMLFVLNYIIKIWVSRIILTRKFFKKYM